MELTCGIRCKIASDTKAEAPSAIMKAYTYSYTCLPTLLSLLINGTMNIPNNDPKHTTIAINSP